MPYPKRVKIGGSFYKGYKLAVGAPTGDYVLDMELTTACAVTALTVIPDTYGVGDTFKLEHLDSAAVAVSAKSIIAETIYNMGAYASVVFDLAAMQVINANDKFRLTYTNVAGEALNVYVILERIR